MNRTSIILQHTIMIKKKQENSSEQITKSRLNLKNHCTFYIDMTQICRCVEYRIKKFASNILVIELLL